MNIGVIKEIKTAEMRVALTPEGVRQILASGKHTIYIEQNAGKMAGFLDEDYKRAGGEIIQTAKEVYKKASLIVHVKEPLPKEYTMLRSDHIFFSYLHLAAAPELTKKLMSIGLTGFAYETLEDAQHNLPCLAPMSKVAGKIAFTYALYFQQKIQGGKGIFLGAIDGKPLGNCVVIGGGILGTSAAECFSGIGASLTIVEVNAEKRKSISTDDLEKVITQADVIIGAALIPGAKAPILISKHQIQQLKPGTMIIDLSIDQGGITELSRPTSIKEPIFIYNDIIFCCIPNIPGTLPRTSTQLLTQATLPYVIELANQGLDIIRSNHSFQTALNVYQGFCTNKGVADAVGVPFRDIKQIIG
jgi:alanine dehydrogenase